MTFTSSLLILTVVLLVLPTETYAFGAGDIPAWGYLNAKAYRHGDIEGVLSDLVKNASTGGSVFAFAKKILGKDGPKFKGSDIKKVYFVSSELLWLAEAGLTEGNRETGCETTLRCICLLFLDYTDDNNVPQAMDIASLSKLSGDTILLIVSV
ncbi:hypothetical protein MPER_06908, partial [Moniliophthora perniciosa FA553]